MKRLLLIVLPLLLISVGFSQQLIPQITETYDNGTIKSIKFFTEIRNRLELRVEKDYFDDGRKKMEINYKDGYKSGELTKWYWNGTISYQANYITGRRFGISYSRYGVNGKIRSEGYYLNDKREGIHTQWYKNGQKEWEATYKDGIIQDGLVIHWYENGQKETEKTYKDGEKISSNEWTEDGKRNGIHTKWFENGQKEWEGTWNEDGEKDGLLTIWYENGQMRSEGTMKDGKLDGLVTSWYENGQMSGEGTYKDGKVISKKEWNEDGSVKE